MNHDYAHCYDYTDKCPERCFRARLTMEIKEKPYLKPIVSWMRFKGTEECEIIKGEST